jgi:hypothetical protein
LEEEFRPTFKRAVDKNVFDLVGKTKETIRGHDALDVLDLNTNKDERCMARNSRETGIVIFTCATNLKCLSDQIKDIFIDSTSCFTSTFFSSLS